jgi:hypothetical protein
VKSCIWLAASDLSCASLDNLNSLQDYKPFLKSIVCNDLIFCFWFGFGFENLRAIGWLTFRPPLQSGDCSWMITQGGRLATTLG